LSDPKKGAYENVYMQEMLAEVDKTQGHREKKQQALQKIGKSSKSASVFVRFMVAVVVLAIIGAGVYLIVAEPKYATVVGAFLGVFVFFCIIVAFMRRG
jgi:hypothetical protein